MSCYSFLAPWYDKLTGDVPYEDFADFYECEFRRCGGQFSLLLDLCCGTGSLTRMLALRGYEMIGVDASVDMLMEAREKSAGLINPPLFLCQDAAELDLYGTVDAAVCSLDGMNYIPPEDLPELLRRLSALPETRWLRVLYCYPDNTSDELLQLMHDDPKICSYIDIPLQHVHDKVLREMNRRGDHALIDRLYHRIRELGGFALRTTMIAGFPGETEEEFQELLQFVQELSLIHISEPTRH